MIIISIVKSYVIIKQEGVSNPINFYEALMKIEKIDLFSLEYNKIINLINFKYDFDLNSFIVQALNNVSTNDELLKVTPVCKQLLKELRYGIKLRDLWALNGKILELIIQLPEKSPVF